MEYVDINGKRHIIKTEIHAKQCEAYHEAIKNKDFVAAHYLYIPPFHKPWRMIKSEINMLQLMDNLEYEQRRINDMPTELLKIETEIKI